MDPSVFLSKTKNIHTHTHKSVNCRVGKSNSHLVFFFSLCQTLQEATQHQCDTFPPPSSLLCLFLFSIADRHVVPRFRQLISIHHNFCSSRVRCPTTISFPYVASAHSFSLFRTVFQPNKEPTHVGESVPHVPKLQSPSQHPREVILHDQQIAGCPVP